MECVDDSEVVWAVLNDMFIRVQVRQEWILLGYLEKFLMNHSRKSYGKFFLHKSPGKTMTNPKEFLKALLAASLVFIVEKMLKKYMGLEGIYSETIIG